MGEKYRKHVYCESKFLEICISKTKNWKVGDSDFKELEMWICLESMLCSSDIILHLDVSECDFITLTQQPNSDYKRFLQRLSVQQISGKSHIKLSEKFITPDIIDPKSNDQLTACYLTCLDAKATKIITDELGVLILNPYNIKECDFMLFDNGAAILKNKNLCWSAILKRFPSNCLAMIDNYIFNDMTVGKENLKDLFDALLPEEISLEIPFQIAIFTTLKKNNNRDDVNSKDCFKEIANLIGEIRPNLYFTLAIFKTNSFHDRVIVTNNVYISCAGGFDLKKSGKAEKTTTVCVIVPYLNKTTKWVSAAYSNIVNEISGVAQKATEFKDDCLSGFYVDNNKNNRLFVLE